MKHWPHRLPAPRLLGKKAILKTGIWIESKAVIHYAELLKHIDWDEETRKIVEKDAADEDGHINRWKAMLERVWPLRCYRLANVLIIFTFAAGKAYFFSSFNVVHFAASQARGLAMPLLYSHR